MKAVCSFCKTEFGILKSGAGKCPVCGHRVGTPRKKSPTAKLFVAAALFLAASLFAVAAFDIFNRNRRSELLTVSISDVRMTEREYIVRGNIRNFSDRVHSVPDMVFVLKTESGAALNRIIVLPPNGLIEPQTDIEFVKRIGPRVAGAEKISVQFAGEVE